jgi:hypothetical protein
MYRVRGEAVADRFSVDITDTLTPALEKLADRAVDFTRNEDEMHTALAGVVQRNFDTRGGLVGGWTPRKARRSAAPVDHPLMQHTGGLQRSLTRRDAPGAVFDVSRDTITYGSSLPHALAHQRGVPSRNLPARPVIPSPEVFAEAVRRVQRGDAIRLAKGLGFDVET